MSRRYRSGSSGYHDPELPSPSSSMGHASMTPPDAEQFHPYWQPGIPLPISPCSTPLSRNPRPVPMYTTPPAPVSTRQVELDDETTSSNSTIEDTLKSILSYQKQFQKQMDQVLRRVDILEDSVKGSSLSSNSDDKKKTRLSSELCGLVASVYQSFAPEKKFHLDEMGNSTWNQSVKKHIKEEVQLDKENKYPVGHIETAVKRHFESRKRLFRESQPSQKERVLLQEKQRKTRSRRQRLFDRRKKHVRDSELKHWEQLSIEYMSLESSDDEDSGTIVVHHLPWTSKKVKDFLKLLDDRADQQRQSGKHYAAERKKRRDGVEAEAIPPTDAPKWTIAKEWKKKDSEQAQETSMFNEFNDDDSED